MKKKIFCLVLGFITIITIKSQIGIGTATPQPSSILELSSLDKALILPRVSLISTTDITTVPNPVKGLLVYNLSDSGTGTSMVYKDLIYLYDGTLWQALMDYKLATNTINMPVLFAKGRKTTTNTICTGLSGANFNLDTIDNLNTNGSITADRTGFYKFTARIVQYFQVEFIPLLSTPSGTFSYNFRGAAGYQDRKVTTSGVVYLTSGQTSSAFFWGLGGFNVCDATHRIREQEVIWTYLGDL
ncbi:hypothetical protein A0O34_21285 [Chryseobacterium glaciei]|uniref:C1q domain-containing protein n=1 Tax=Chryseobacterium glaciei TaxID=1685010 RepID=A0A172Y0W5_9FLAO|nr:hypothetical protein [Chryseobacterium glaciei]ANF52898.1 hypothetical protein A0O34_21285 [Chryseobacterium glaciei]